MQALTFSQPMSLVECLRLMVEEKRKSLIPDGQQQQVAYVSGDGDARMEESQQTKVMQLQLRQ